MLSQRARLQKSIQGSKVQHTITMPKAVLINDNLSHDLQHFVRSYHDVVSMLGEDDALFDKSDRQVGKNVPTY